jgi:hypothetical protein
MPPRFVHEAGHLDPRDRASVLGRVALVVVEVRGHRHYCRCNRLAEEGFDLLQEEPRELLGGELPVTQAHGDPLTHRSLERGGRSFGVGCCLTAGWLALQHLAVTSQRRSSGMPCRRG